MFEEYMKKKINEVKNIPERELIEMMYENGCLLEAEYEKYISQLEEQNKEQQEKKITNQEMKKQ